MECNQASIQPAGTTMTAVVCKVNNCSLLVCDCASSQEVIVHCGSACRHCCGDRVCIHYNGVMTASLPPQISATCIETLSSCGF